MQNFVGKTKCIAGYMKVANSSREFSSRLCFVIQNASYSRRLAGSISGAIILASMFWVLSWHVMRCFFTDELSLVECSFSDRVGIVLYFQCGTFRKTCT